MNAKIVLMMTVILRAPALAAAEMLSVVPQEANIRSGPGADYEVIWKAARYYPLEVVDRDGDWVSISDFENDEGWIYSSLLSHTPAVVVVTAKANLREGPGLDYKPLWILEKGYSLKVLETDGDWYKVSDKVLKTDGDRYKVSDDEATGWLHKSVTWGFTEHLLAEEDPDS